MGDIWSAGKAPDWNSLLTLPQAKLHLYGKLEARPGRKMGHVNCLGDTPEQALAQLQQVRGLLIP